MTFNRGKFIYFLKKVCNRLLTIIEVTRKGTMLSESPRPSHAGFKIPLEFAKPAGVGNGGLSREGEGR